MLDYGAIPPEINSARIYAGPGSAPMMAAAAAWRSLAAEISSAATSYETVIAELSSKEWVGPASTAMASAAAPHLSWMSTTAAQAEQTATQATAAAAAYEAARSATVPPSVVTANRTQLAALVATNLLGQNTAAIMANEAHYAEMWAQDAAAMFGYAGSSATAAQLSPFNQPTQNTDPAGQSAQAAATAHAAGTPAGNTAQLAQMMPTLQSSIQSLSSPAAATQPAASGGIIDFLNGLLNNDALNGAAYLLGNPVYNFSNTIGTGAAFIPSSLLPSLVGYLSGGGFNAAGGSALGSGLGGLLGPGGALGALGGLGGSAAGGISSAFSVSAVSGVGPAAVSAGMGQASLVGSFSAPASWAAATPAGAAPVAVQPAGWAVPPESHSMAAMPPAMPAGAGRGSFGYGTPRYGFRPKVMHRPMVC